MAIWVVVDDQGTTLAILLPVQGTYPRSVRPCRYGKCLEEQHVTADALTATAASVRLQGWRNWGAGGRTLPKLWNISQPYLNHGG